MGNDASGREGFENAATGAGVRPPDFFFSFAAGRPFFREAQAHTGARVQAPAHAEPAIIMAHGGSDDLDLIIPWKTEYAGGPSGEGGMHSST